MAITPTPEAKRQAAIEVIVATGALALNAACDGVGEDEQDNRIALLTATLSRALEVLGCTGEEVSTAWLNVLGVPTA